MSDAGSPVLLGRIDYHPPRAGEAAGLWQAACPGLPGVRCQAATFEAVLRKLATAVAGCGHDPSRLRLEVGGLLAMDPATAAGQVHIRDTGISIPHLLRTMAEAGSLEGVLEHFPIIGRAEATAALRFAAAVLDNVRLPLAAAAGPLKPQEGEGGISPAPPEADG